MTYTHKYYKIFSFIHFLKHYKDIMNCKTIFLTVLLFSTSPIAHAQTLHLSIAASMTEAVKEIITTFEQSHDKIRCIPNFASSGSLAKQIEQGAPADLYISANPKWMEYLLKKELIAPGANQIFAYNQLVFLREGKAVPNNMSNITSLDRIAIGNPKSVPAGKYAEQAMIKAGVYDVLKTDKKLILAKDVRQALLYADRGEVDGAFVYATDALLAENAQVAFMVPQNLYSRVSYPVGITIEGQAKPAAKLLYNFILGEKGAAILTKYGFKAATKE